MKSTFKVAVPLAILVAVVFGVTYFWLNAPKGETIEDTGAGEPPVVFFSTERHWEPPWLPETVERRINLQDQNFHGFYEAGKKGTAAFWFENRNPKEATLKLERVSCGACSEGAVYIVPPTTARQTLEMTGVAMLPQGLVTGLPVGMVGPGALFHPSNLPPTAAHKFADPSQVVFKIPAANNPDGWTPQWAILELGFEARPPVELRTLQSVFVSELPGDPPRLEHHQFAIGFEVVEPFRVYPETIDLGQLDESSQPEPREVVVFSSTRSGADFPPPSVVIFAGGADTGKFVAAGPPTAVPETDLMPLAVTLSQKANRPVRVSAAYRIPVKVAPKVGDQRLDIGQLERQIQLSIPGVDHSKAVTVRGVVRGGVWLGNGNAIDLGAFKSKDGRTDTFEVVTDKPETELVVADGQQRPEFVQVSLKKKPDFGGKGSYDVRIHIPPNKQVGLITDGVVVLEVKGGPKPQRVRIPLKGRGEL